MLIEILAGVGLLFLVALAAFEVFWPTSLVLACIAGVAWWRVGLSSFVALWRPELIAAYLIIGVLWVFFKWTRLVEDAVRERDARVPRWSEHSYDFAAYFFYWPLDAIAYMLSDFLQEAWRVMARIVTRSFDRYAEWRFAKAASERRS